MPRFRCPYCKHMFDEPPTETLCPSCGKQMRLPIGMGRRSDLRKRKKKIESIHREIEGKRKFIHYTPPAKPARNPRVLIGVGIVFLVLASLFMARSSKPVKSASRNTPVVKVLGDLTVLSKALGRFHHHVGRYPTEEEGLPVLVDGRGIKGWHGSYIRTLYPDSWNTPYQYMLSNEVAVIFSMGPDREKTTPDDIYADPDELDVGTSWTNNWYRPNIKFFTMDAPETP